MDTPVPHGHATLSDLPVGAVALICGIADTAPELVAMRLRHLGFRAGNVVQAIRVAPLGDPTIYGVLGYHLCLRRHEAQHIKIAMTA